MDSDLDICEPPVKKERLDDVEMVNYEIPVQIDVPDAADAEIDPLMPVDDPADGIQPLGCVEIAEPIKSELEIKEECSVTEKSESNFPKIDCVTPNFTFPKSQILEPSNSESSARSDRAGVSADIEEIYISSDDEVEEITIEPKTEKEISNNVSCDFKLVVGADGPDILQLSHVQQAPKAHDSSIMKKLLSPSSGQLRSPNPSLNVRPLSQTSQQAMHLTGVQRQNYLSSTSIIGQAQDASARILNSMGSMVQNQFARPNSSAVTPSSLQNPLNKQPILEPVSVCKLLEVPFASDAWTIEQKNAIIKSSRLTPIIKLPPNPLGISAEKVYNEIPWICGSSNLNTFFCWPCLLFFHPKVLGPAERWSVPAARVLEGGFNQSWKTHEASHAHEIAGKALNIWSQSLNAPQPPKLKKNQRMGNFTVTEKVRRNRKLLSLLVQSVCYLKKARIDAQIEDYAECFSCIVQFNSELQKTLTTAMSMSPVDFVFKYAKKVEDAVIEFLKSKISDEIKNARFITLFMEDLSTIVDKSTVAIIIHFLGPDGRIQERILELHEIFFNRSAGKLFELFQNIVAKFGLRLKVAGFTYSATLVHPTEIAAFNERVERFCPVAKFFHYQGHNFAQMLFGACSHLNKICRNFFLTITEFQRFFNDDRIISTLRRFEQLKDADSTVPQPEYDFDRGFITTLKRCYPSILKTLSSILECPEDWDSVIITQAPILMSFLREFNTRFMITLINQLNIATMDICEALQGKIDPAKWAMLIEKGVSDLMSIKKYGFSDIYVMSLSPVLVKEPNEFTSEFPADLVDIFNEVIDAVLSFIKQRFDSVDFGYVDLETVAQRYYARLNLRPEETEKFRSQIQFLAKEPNIKDKSLAEALKYFYEHNLGPAVPEYATFLDFAMTIPSSNSSLHCPVVERILKKHHERSCEPSKDSIWMGKELLIDIFRQKKLSEAVIDIFVSQQNSKEFSYQDIGAQ